MKRKAATAFVLVVFAPAAAWTATLCVSPAGGACATSIQGAVNLAGPGDSIRVLPGTYFENVLVPPGRAGLRIVGTSNTEAVVDPGPPRAGPAFQVESDGVEIASIGIRNVSSEGVLVRARLATVRGLLFTGGGGSAIRLDFNATRAHILGNVIRAAGPAAIELVGSNGGTVIRGNHISQMQVGMTVASDDVVVAGNRISMFRRHAILVHGRQSRVLNNVLETGFFPEEGISVNGRDPEVRGNRLVNAGRIFVECLPCTHGRVTGNSVVGSPVGSGMGIVVGADAPGLVVSDNQVTRAVGPAFLVQGTGVRLTGNRAFDTGQPDGGEGYLVRGAGPHVVEGNRAEGSGASGFRVESNGVTLAGNVSMSAGLNGFVVGGPVGTHTGNVLTDNRALGSNAAGFAVIGGAAATVLVGNGGSANRYDFCDDGSATDVSGGNPFGTTSSVCDVTR
jgi:hypothetical protein